MATTVIDPNVLNPYVLLDPSIAPAVAGAVSAASILLSLVVSRYFFRSYRFSGFGYLLGFPVGFAFLGASFAAEQLGLIYSANPLLHPALFWMQLLLQSEAFALIAISYCYKNSSDGESGGRGRRLRARDLLVTALPLAMVAVPFMVPTSALATAPYFNYAGLADLSFYMRLFNMAVLGYIFKSTVVSLVRAANVRMLYVPAGFALLWLEQYSLVITYFDNSAAALVGSALARVLALALFVYAMHSVTSGRRMVEEEIEARKKT